MPNPIPSRASVMWLAPLSALHKPPPPLTDLLFLVAAAVQVRSGKGKKDGPLDGIGKGGAMGAGGGGGSYDEYAGSGSSRRIEMQSGRG